MKSFNLISLPWRRTLIIAAVIFCSMAFRNPFSPVSKSPNLQVQSILVADTVPKDNININIDVSKILAEVDITLAKIDFEKIAKDVQLSLEKIDFAKMQKDIEASLKSIDWEKMNKDIKISLDKIDNKKIKIEIERSMKDARKQ